MGGWRREVGGREGGREGGIMSSSFNINCRSILEHPTVDATIHTSKREYCQRKPTVQCHGDPSRLPTSLLLG